MNYTTPIICNRKKDLTKDWYIEFRFQGKRFRFKSGKQFGITDSGNSIQNKRDRRKYFQEVAQAAKDKLSQGWNSIKGLNSEKLKDSIQFYLQHPDTQRLHPKTQEDYRQKITHLSAFLPKSIKGFVHLTVSKIKK